MTEIKPSTEILLERISAIEKQHKFDVENLQSQINDLNRQLSISRDMGEFDSTEMSQEDPYIPSVESLIESAVVGEVSVVGKPPCVSREAWLATRS